MYRYKNVPDKKKKELKSCFRKKPMIKKLK